MNEEMIKALQAPLKGSQIELRVARKIENKGAFLLAYKDARCDMQRLDEVVGPLNWKREHTRDNHNCIVSIWDSEKGLWVSKEDTGTESNTEAQKGLASDSFKRACFNWGIGRELYAYPDIFIPATGNDLKFMNPRRWTTFVQHNEDRTPNYIAIKDEKGNKIYSWGVLRSE